MVNAALLRCGAALLLGAVVLVSAAWLRSAEYDEQYTLFLTAGVARPAWPDVPFAAGNVRRLQAGQASLARIAHDLRATDVHPPLYFWAVALWRRAFGPSLFAARLLSVLCSLAALAIVGNIAVCAGIPPALAMLLTLGCYGFAYTGAIARGFAMPQLLAAGGVLVLLRARARPKTWCWAGLLFGAASAANYLAMFVGIAAIGWAAAIRGSQRPPRPHEVLLWSGFGLAPWLVLDLSFFLVQRGSRPGQFPTFHLAEALHRLAMYTAANLCGGLPLYVSAGIRPFLSAAFAGLLLALTALVFLRWRSIGRPDTSLLFSVAALAPPFGLLLLGLVFNDTPIELRYLAFATPFAALLLAGACARLSKRTRVVVVTAVVSIQTTALAGLLTRPETMQPARAAAQAVAPLAGDALVLLPRGNDGVGIVGAFSIESPPALRLLAIDTAASAAAIRHRAAGERRVLLALIAQDGASRATLPHMLAAFQTPRWRNVVRRSNLAAFERICDGE